MYYKTLEIPKHIRLSKDDMNNHIVNAKNGEQKSIDILINNNLKLVIKIANKFNLPNLELEDLVQEGVLGLLEAINRFDFSKNVKFTSFAGYWIINKIGEYCRKNGNATRIPNYLIADSKKIIKFKQDYHKKNDRWPESKEISKNLKFTTTKINRALELFGEVYSLNQKINDLDVDLSDILPDKKDRENLENNNYIKIFNILSEQEREMLELNSGLWNDGKVKTSYKSLAQKYSMTYREVKNSLNRSKRKIKRELRKLKK